MAAAVGLLLGAAAPGRAEEETRALWVVRYSLTSIGSVERVVEIADQMNMNTLLVQVRGRGDAYYPSEVAPRAEELESMPRDYDPFTRLIERAHAQGLEVQAWINCYLVWSAGRLPSSPLHVVNAHPDWIAVRSDGRKLVEMVPEEFQDEKVEGMYLAPGNPEVRRHLRDVVREIVTHYHVDGIHLDYVRNPEPDVGYDAGTRTAFMREFGIDPVSFASSPDSSLLTRVGTEGIADLRARWMQWQRDQVTAFVRDVRNDLDLINPKLKLTAAVIADQTAALNR
ncbi:MAG TPA: family 10 glycosylhydrolase, partial [Candidatus Binatia bacterium]|nr:family 10 glycosylhydrolase [Candidatus Binatia bacterium]